MSVLGPGAYGDPDQPGLSRAQFDASQAKPAEPVPDPEPKAEPTKESTDV